jgi:sarcosine oxidase
VVLAADAWTNEILSSFDRRLPLTITKEQVTYFASPDPAAFAPDRFPVWIWMDEPCFYGFPTYGEAGPKAAQDCGGDPVDPDRRTFARDEAAYERVEAFLARHLPAAVGPPIYTKTCLYTLTPDRDLVVDRLPGEPGVVVALGAAHGFKFASVLGRILAELSVDGSTPSAVDLARFRIDRPILLEADPPTSWMV